MVLLFVAGGIVFFGNRPRNEPQDATAKKTAGIEGTSSSIDGTPDSTSKIERPENRPLDDGGYTFGSPEWQETAAGKDVIKRLVRTGNRSAALVDKIDPDTREQILESLVFLQFAPDVPMENYQPKQPVPNDWEAAVKILKKTVAYSLGPDGTDPKFIYSDDEYFLFSNRHHEDFSSGEALRKSDGAVFKWNLQQTNGVDG